MKPSLVLFGVSCALAVQLPAQQFGPAIVAPPATSTAAQSVLRTAEQLDVLFGPIALYPDALMALILPASTEPSDIVLAARYLAAGGDPAGVDDQPWDDSVKSLAHYPDIVKWMDENLAWTKQTGEAFADQPADVMKAIQRLRGRARAAGALTSTAQQVVVVEDGEIRILPAQPEVIYVPRYDPAVVYVERPVYYWTPDPFIDFGVGYPTGLWLAYNLDWPRRTVFVVARPHRERYWREFLDWHRPRGVIEHRNHFPGYYPSVWRPISAHPRPPRPPGYQTHVSVATPRPFPGAPPRPANWGRNDSDHRGLPDRRETPPLPGADSRYTHRDRPRDPGAESRPDRRRPDEYPPGSNPRARITNVTSTTATVRSTVSLTSSFAPVVSTPQTSPHLRRNQSVTAPNSSGERADRGRRPAENHGVPRDPTSSLNRQPVAMVNAPAPTESRVIVPRHPRPAPDYSGNGQRNPGTPRGPRPMLQEPPPRPPVAPATVYAPPPSSQPPALSRRESPRRDERMRRDRNPNGF